MLTICLGDTWATKKELIPKWSIVNQTTTTRTVETTTTGVSLGGYSARSGATAHRLWFGPYGKSRTKFAPLSNYSTTTPTRAFFTATANQERYRRNKTQYTTRHRQQREIQRVTRTKGRTETSRNSRDWLCSELVRSDSGVVLLSTVFSWQPGKGITFFHPSGHLVIAQVLDWSAGGCIQTYFIEEQRTINTLRGIDNKGRYRESLGQREGQRHHGILAIGCAQNLCGVILVWCF
jgi:hypothetical protein